MIGLGRAVALLVVSLISIMSLGQSTSSETNQQSVAGSPSPTRTEGLAAWQQVYSVMSHPRCINCHTATDHPDQAGDRHAHNFHVVRGKTGFGVPGLNCATCHQSANADSTGVPGAPAWRLAPLSMAWQDTNDKIFDSGALCRAVTKRNKNANMVGAALLKHHEDEPLVLWAFQPGHRADGSMRTLPPLTHAQFVTATSTWVAAGTPCP